MFTRLKRLRGAADNYIAIITRAEKPMCQPAAPSPAPAAANPVQPEAYVLSLISQGKLRAALEAIGEFGDGAIYWPDFHNQAQRLMLAGRLEAAAEAARAAINLDPDRAQGHQTLGEIRLRQGQWRAAEESFRCALERDRRCAAARFGLGRALRQQGKRRQALEALVAAMESEPRAEWVAELQRAMRRGARRERRREARSDGEDVLLRRAERAARRAREASARTTPLPTVSVCMIVRDEQESLPRCLESVRRLADEIIIVDTGSQDATVDIARRLGAQVHGFPWCDDFSAARNESLRHATSDWILVLDADDELGNPSGLKEYLATLRPLGFAQDKQAQGHPAEARKGRPERSRGASGQDVKLCSMRTRIPHRGRAGETIVEHPRLFRNHAGFHYRGPVHEQLCDGSGDAAVADAALDLCVYHHGYLEDEPEQTKRHQRNLRILRAWIERNPQDPWAHFCLGQAHYTNHDMEQAIPSLILALQHAAPDRAYRPKAYAYLASAQSAAGHHRQAEETCLAGLNEFANQAELLFCLGYALECQGRTAEAIAAYEAATRGRFGPMLAHHDFTCRDLKPLARLAEIHIASGRLSEAEDCLRRIEHIRGPVPALESLRERIAAARRLRGGAAASPDALAQAQSDVNAEPTDTTARVRLAALLLRSADSAHAEEQIDAAIELDPACPEALNLKGVLLCSRGDYSAAAEHFQRAAALRPSYADALANLGAARLRLNDVTGAERSFREAAATDESCFAAHFALAEISRSRGDSRAALPYYEAAVRADASDRRAWLGMARCYLECEQYEPAARCYERAVEMGGAAAEIMAEIEQVRRRLARCRPGAEAHAPAPPN
jgi:tetratricopeptide (TPR) repeat protein